MVRLLLCCALLALAACSKPQPPEKDRPVEPQAQAHTEPRDAMQAPIDKARQAEADVEQAQDARDAALEAAGG
jgi:hypothetical protein